VRRSCFGQIDNLNLYTYAKDDPLNSVDPAGLECTGSRLENSDGTCASTVGNTTDLAGAAQGTQWQRAVAALTPTLAAIFTPAATNTIVTDLKEHLESVEELGLKLTKWATLGRAGEQFADRFLNDEGYTVLAKQLFVLTNRGLRITDILATGGDAGGTIRGFEVKVNNFAVYE
jgi:hypothetical protein